MYANVFKSGFLDIIIFVFVVVCVKKNVTNHIRVFITLKTLTNQNSVVSATAEGLHSPIYHVVWIAGRGGIIVIIA